MNILSVTQVLLVGENAMSYPLPNWLNTTNNVQAKFLAVQNCGGSDCYVVTGPNLGIQASSAGTLIAAPTSGVAPGTLVPTSSLAIGPVVSVPLGVGDRYFSAITSPANVALAYTTATGSDGASTFTVADATGIANGQSVAGVGVQADTIVAGISGTTVTISLPLTSDITGSQVTFSAPPSPAPPGLLILALGA